MVCLALAMPNSPWCLSFALGQLQPQSELLGHFAVFLPSQCWCARFGRAKCNNQHLEGKKTGQKWKNSIGWRCPNYSCHRLYEILAFSWKSWPGNLYFTVWVHYRLPSMNDFPVIGDLVMRTGLWDRQGANIGNRYKEMYGVELFLRLRPVSLDRECRILPWFYEKRRWLMLVRWL